MKEIFKNIKGYEGLYQVSNYGNIKSLSRIINNSGNYKGYFKSKEKILKGTIRKDGYKVVKLIKDGKEKKYLIHRLVAETFLDNHNNYLQVNHIDGNKQNNNISNLEFCSNKENSYHRDFILNNKKKIKCIETNIIYNSFTEVQDKTNINKNNVCQCCKGNLKSAGGYHWQYV